MNASKAHYGLALVVVAFFIMMGAQLHAQTQTKNSPIEKQTWAKHSQGIDYTEHFITREPKYRKDFKLPAFDFAGLGAILFVIIIAGLIFLILRILIIKGILNVKQAKKKFQALSLQDVEANIEEADLDALLHEALQNQLYYLAIRLHFLMVLKTMYAKQFISYKKDKTNGEYLRELKATQLHIDFKKLVTVYEKVWYGNFAINAHSYQVVANQFHVFTKKLNGHVK